MTPLCKWPFDHLILRVILGRGILGARGFFSCCWLLLLAAVFFLLLLDAVGCSGSCVCTSSPDRGFAANNRKKTLAPRVGSGLRQIELNGTVLWEHYNNNNNDNNNIHLYSAFLLVTQSALQLVNT